MTIEKLIQRGIWTNRMYVRRVYVNYELVELNKPDRYVSSIEYYNTDGGENFWLPNLIAVKDFAKQDIGNLEVMHYDKKNKVIYLKGE